MSLDYEKIAAKQSDQDSMWSSYSDLFMILSMVFLLLYVNSSLRSGIFSVQKNMEYQELTSELQDLKEQNQVYNTLKDDHLDTRASTAEKEMYEELMEKLSLLQDEAKAEKEQLRMRALENEKKEEALNHYQRIIRNILNANVLAKAGLKRRDKVIEKKQGVIESQIVELGKQSSIIAENEKKLEEQQKEIALKEKLIANKKMILARKSAEIESLNLEITKKKVVIADNNKQIQMINRNLKDKIKGLQKSKISRSKLQKAISELKAESKDSIENLKKENNKISSQLTRSRAKMYTANRQLAQAERTLTRVEKEKQKLSGDLEASERQFDVQSKKMQQDFAQAIRDKEQKFQEAVDRQKMSDAEKKKQLKKLEKEVARQTRDFEDKVKKLKNKIKESEKSRKKAEEQADKYRDYLDAVKKQNESMEDDLNNLRPLVKARQDLARNLKENLRKVGLSAAVDQKTGDVVLTFGNEYFDTDSHVLKKNMKHILRRFVPAYSKSLFGDRHIAEKISSVEIIGFASPTYKGRYIDPQSLSEADRMAVRYNLDLSYKRAKSIFEFIFDTRKMVYTHQKKLLPLVKVTGRSFLSKGISGKGVSSGMSRRVYCKKYNCKKEQRVIIKFNLSD